MKTLLIAALALLASAHVATLVHALRLARRTSPEGTRRPSAHHLAVGFVTNFFDTLGIGNFAPTTAWFRSAKLVPDQLIPGTMNVGHTLPVMLMAFLFLGIVEIGALTLVSMILSAVVGAWLGAGVVARLPKRGIQLGMGVGLVVAALLMAAFQLGLKPQGADALSLEVAVLVPACLAIALLGALMTIGVGLYAPCMILVSLLGMNPVAAFPIMMGACAFLMPVASARFARSQKLHWRAALGLTLGGIPAVLVAALVVRSLPLDALKWLVVVVVLVTAIQMLRAARCGPSST